MTRTQKLEIVFFIVRVVGAIIIDLSAGGWAALGCFILVAGESAARTVGTLESIKLVLNNTNLMLSESTKLVLEAVGEELDKKADK